MGRQLLHPLQSARALQPPSFGDQDAPRLGAKGCLEEPGEVGVGPVALRGVRRPRTQQLPQNGVHAAPAQAVRREVHVLELDVFGLVQDPAEVAAELRHRGPALRGAAAESPGEWHLGAGEHDHSVRTPLVEAGSRDRQKFVQSVRRGPHSVWVLLSRTVVPGQGIHPSTATVRGKCRCRDNLPVKTAHQDRHRRLTSQGWSEWQAVQR
mmetsp:Transcript_144781/g.403436  ORF Transcript_144781/g.403436 Transcript_144781/m.403436 type:complete len:209 (-) Transcript_144781:290-916(-)